ncbi:MAG: class I SAM-dependent methyltransferase [Gammaproteobacteria bacterium]
MNKNRKPRQDQKKPRKSMAERADKYKLYESSVQSADADIDFVDHTFHSLKKRRAARLREDFCGTANNSCAWVRLRSGNLALAVDHDPRVLEWGRVHHVAGLPDEQARRIRLACQDMLRVAPETMDMVLALNFSYWVFRERRTMLRYFRRVHAALAEDGIFFLDAFGGFEALREMRENTRYGNFTYIWDQASYDPVTGDYLCKIHYKFSDGSMLREAFIYHWRLWTLPELIEMLGDSGFRVTVHWEGTAPDGGGNGIFAPVTRGEADACWIAYLVAEKVPE